MPMLHSPTIFGSTAHKGLLERVRFEAIVLSTSNVNCLFTILRFPVLYYRLETYSSAFARTLGISKYLFALLEIRCRTIFCPFLCLLFLFFHAVLEHWWLNNSNFQQASTQKYLPTILLPNLAFLSLIRIYVSYLSLNLNHLLKYFIVSQFERFRKYVSHWFNPPSNNVSYWNS